jgi:beta-mannosidase
VLKMVAQPLTLKANSSAEVFASPTADMLAGAAPASVLMHASLATNDGVVVEDRLYFWPVKDLALPSASVMAKVKDLGAGAFAIGLTSTTLAKNLYLSFDDIDGAFSDNYFDLLPGETKIVEFKPTQTTSAPTLEAGLKLMHMALVT